MNFFFCLSVDYFLCFAQYIGILSEGSYQKFEIYEPKHCTIEAEKYRTALFLERFSNPFFFSHSTASWLIRSLKLNVCVFLFCLCVNPFMFPQLIKYIKHFVPILSLESHLSGIILFKNASL